MPLREPDFIRFRDAVLCRQPDCVPLVDLYHDIEIKDAFLGRPIAGLADDVRFWYEAGYDYYNLDLKITGGTERVNPTDAYRRRRRERDAVTMRTDAPEDAIATMADFDAYAWPAPGDANLGALDEVAGYLPEGMLAVARSSGIYENVIWRMGHTAFAYAMVDSPELLRRMFARCGELAFNIYRAAAPLPHIGALWIADDLAYAEGLLFSPLLMRELLFPWYEELGALARRYDKPLILHSDGRLYEVLDDLIALGFNAIQPIEPKAMDARLLKEKYGGRLALLSTIDLGGALSRGTPEEVEAEVRVHIRDLAPGGGFGVGASNTVPWYVPLRNFNAMREACARFGRYPIRA